MEKVLNWEPIATAPAHVEVELSVYDEGKYHALVFPCRRDGDGGVMYVPIVPCRFTRRIGGFGNASVCDK